MDLHTGALQLRIFLHLSTSDQMSSKPTLQNRNCTHHSDVSLPRKSTPDLGLNLNHGVAQVEVSFPRFPCAHAALDYNSRADARHKIAVALPSVDGLQTES